MGKQVAGGAPSINAQGMDATDTVAMLSQLGPMIQQAMATGNVQITQGDAQMIDMRGTDLGEQIKGIMAQHGIDPEKGTVNARVDTNTYLANAAADPPGARSARHRPQRVGHEHQRHQRGDRGQGDQPGQS